MVVMWALIEEVRVVIRLMLLKHSRPTADNPVSSICRVKRARAIMPVLMLATAFKKY